MGIFAKLFGGSQKRSMDEEGHEEESHTSPEPETESPAVEEGEEQTQPEAPTDS